MWGYYFGHTLTVRKYNAIATDPNATAFARAVADDIRIRNLNQLENNIPDNVINIDLNNADSRGWIPFGYLHDMTDDVENVGITGIDDQVNTYNLRGVFRGMQSNVLTPCEYVDEALRRNAFSQTAEMQIMMADYQWPCN